VKPQLQEEDPFVGFAASVPLFVRTTGEDGTEVMATAPNRLSFFNHQEFSIKKDPGAYRIFSLGGSTTYGRPYDDMTSFSGWLRELLPVADPQRKWEVINAGGISYASYRVAHLMKELLRYEPDLFIVYSGHNEFLEERTYGSMRDTPAVVRTAAEVLSRTRTWSAMSTVLNKLGTAPSLRTDKRDELAGEVDTILNRSTGPEQYERDDSMRDRILQHYRVSLERMVNLARSAGADVIFVTPASNLKDSSPFKSQHTDGLSEEDRTRSEELLSKARGHIGSSQWSEALRLLDEATAIDTRFAEHHYQRGKVLVELGRYDEAAKAFQAALEEDVCPLRALSPMREILADVAEEKDVTTYGHSIAGREYFLDHVHPTIEGHRLLAAGLIQTMEEKGIVSLSSDWGDEAITEVAARVEAGLDKEEHARALVNLARLMKWAGKAEDSMRIAREALTLDVDDPEILKEAAAIAAISSQKQGDHMGAVPYYQKVLAKDPNNPGFRLHFGFMFLKPPLLDYEVAGAHILLASVLSPDNDVAHKMFGIAMAERQRYDLAYPSIMEASRLNPDVTSTSPALGRLRELIGPDSLYPSPAKVILDMYESGGPLRMVQVRPDSTGREIPDGILTEWYDNGMLKRFADYQRGVQHGVDIYWNPDGEVISKVIYQHGLRMDNTGTVLDTLNNTKALSHYDRGVAFANEGRLDESLENLKTAVSLYPHNPRFHNMLGTVYARQGSLDEAIEEFKLANQINPSEPAYSRNLERAYRLKGKGNR
jgi:tetratricopeptide (TPR) repeat protein